MKVYGVDNKDFYEGGITYLVHCSKIYSDSEFKKLWEEMGAYDSCWGKIEALIKQYNFELLEADVIVEYDDVCEMTEDDVKLQLERRNKAETWKGVAFYEKTYSDIE